MGIAVLLIFVSGTLFLISKIPELESRIQNGVNTLNADNIDKTSSESNAVRILVWRAASQAFAESGLWGYGTGDVKDELFSRYEQNGYSGALEHKLNAHNQFLQTGIALGWIGFLLLLLTIILPLLTCWKQKNFLFVGFIVMIGINLLTESMLEAEAGVIFIAFFQSLLFFRSTSELP
jgi:O-antigen ligase